MADAQSISMEIKIVPYEPKLKDGVFAFTKKCFEKLGKNFEPEGRHECYNDIERHYVKFFCLVEGNRIVGTVALKKLDEYTAELKSLYLAQELRGKGLGKQLLDKAIMSARELGFTSIVLDSMSKYTDAVKLYEKVGFKHIERYNDNQYADVFMKMEI